MKSETIYQLASPVYSSETVKARQQNASIKTIDGRDYVVFDKGDTEVRVPFHNVKAVLVPKGAEPKLKPVTTETKATDKKVTKK